MSNLPTQGPILHIRYEGTSLHFSFQEGPLAQYDIGPNSPDASIKAAIAAHFGVATTRLDAYVVERQPNGNMTLRPEAVFG